MKKILLISIALITSIFTAFGQDLYNLFIKEKVFKHKIVQKNISEEKKKEIDNYITKKNTQANIKKEEDYTQQDLDNISNSIHSTDAEFYQKISYRYVLYVENYIKNNALLVSKKGKKKIDYQQSNNLELEKNSENMKTLRKKYQNCVRDAKYVNKIQIKDQNNAPIDPEVQKKQQINENYQNKKTESDCKKLILLELDRIPLK